MSLVNLNAGNYEATKSGRIEDIEKSIKDLHHNFLELKDENVDLRQQIKYLQAQLVFNYGVIMANNMQGFPCSQSKFKAPGFKAQGNGFEERGAEERVAEERVAEERGAEERVADDKNPEAEDHDADEPEVADPKDADPEVADPEVADPEDDDPEDDYLEDDDLEDDDPQADDLQDDDLEDDDLEDDDLEDDDLEADNRAEDRGAEDRGAKVRGAKVRGAKVRGKLALVKKLEEKFESNGVCHDLNYKEKNAGKGDKPDNKWFPNNCKKFGDHKPIFYYDGAGKSGFAWIYHLLEKDPDYDFQENLKTQQDVYKSYYNWATNVAQSNKIHIHQVTMALTAAEIFKMNKNGDVTWFKNN